MGKKALHLQEALKLALEAGALLHAWFGTVLEGCVNAFPFSAGVTRAVNTQAEILSLGRRLQEILGVVPIMAQEFLCIPVLFVLDLC